MKATYKQLSRRVLAALLAAVMVLSITVFAADDTSVSDTSDATAETESAMPFTDVSEGSWYYDYVLEVYQRGLMVGTGETTFAPNDGTTRGMVITTLYSLAGKPDVTDLEIPFEDVSEGAWYYDAVLWAYNTGVAAGRSDTVFDPNTPITREEMVTFFYSYAINILDKSEEDMEALAAEADLSGYTDAEDISEYAETTMSWAVAAGLIVGTSATTLSPAGTSTRAQLATVLTQFYAYAAEETETTLSVGAGNGEIVFTAEVFENNSEGFSGEIDSNPYARILLLEDEEKVAIVSLELVSTSSDMITTIKEIVNEITGTPTENVWVHCNHTITTPHAPSEGTALEAYTAALTAAVTEAAQEAQDSFQPATMSIGTGTCEVNANRDIEIDGVQYYGLGSDGYSDHTLTVIRFDGVDGEPIGMYINYGIKPTAVDNAEKSTNSRVVSSDVTGLACVMMEEEYDCPVMFVMPATGDQIPVEETMYYAKDEDGSVYEHSLTVEEGLEIVDRLGTEMGNVSISVAAGAGETMETITSTTIKVGRTSYDYANKAGDGTVSIDISAITIGDDVAMVGFKPELNAITGTQLQEASPYKYTLLTSFLDGDQKYMPDAEAYVNQTWEWSRSGFGEGCAEKFVEVAVELLTQLKEDTYVDEGGGSSSSGSYLGGTVELGGYTWTILSETDDAYLVLCDSVVGYYAYNADGEATWETSDIRAYLNGDFYEETFTEDEKALIVETTLSNPANLHYGIDGGNDTTDNVFLLDLEAAEAYLNGTDLIVATNENGEGVWWYLRSPGEAKDVAAGVTATGTIDYHGTAAGMSEEDAIRPAMWVSKEAADQAETISADDAIVQVSAIGFVDADGAKLQAIAVEYSVELAADSISLEDYNVLDYGTLTSPSCELGENPGQAINIYVNDTAAVSADGGTDTGRYVIIEVNTDYQLASVPSYQQAVAAGVEQVNDLTDVDGNTITASTEAAVNYETVESEGRNGTTITYEAIDGTYSFEDLEGYQLFYKDGTDDGEDGGYDTTSAFWAYDCFDEADGELHDVELPYALYVPEDYDPDGNYGLVIQIENAGFLGDDPMIVLTESQAAANFASDEIQEYFKDASGLDGLIVVCPQISNDIRTTRDNWSTSCGVPATWQLLDYLTETYSIDEDHIYGTGESMGGMQILCMASQRDNYFAALWLPGCQWGSCYNLEEEYSGSVYYSSDDATIWREDADGNSTIETNSLGEEVIARNLYYLISDDNILATTCTGDSFATGVWQELWYLFYDIGGVEIPTATVLPLEDSVADMNDTLTALVNSKNDTGIYWLAQDGGSHMLTWVYAHKLDAGYYWLLSQDRQTELERDKIAQFANDWEEADEETSAAVNAADEGRYLATVTETDEDGNEYSYDVYYAVPAEGAGTSGYNSYWSDRGTPISGKEPGWTVNTMTVQTDGSTTIVDASYDNLYAEGTAEEGVAALVAAGAVTVNGVAISGDEVSINGAKALWQDEDGTWAWKTHIMYSGSGLTYDEAAYEFVVGMSRLRGPSYTLTLNNGVVTAIDFIIWDGAFAETVTIDDTYTTVTICGDEGDGSMNRTDPSTIQFSNEYVEADSEGVMPSDQCLILYYQDGDGNWHMKRADSETITYTSDYTYTDSLINLEYSQAWNRPTQPIKALGWMGIESAEMIQWFYCDGITSAFSHVDAQSVLQTAVEKAEALLESLVVSEDGTDVTEDTLWVTQEDYDLYAGAVATAKAVVEDDTLLNTDYEEALLHLAQAYGGDGTNYSKSGNVFEDGIGITNRAQSGTATE